MGTLLILEPMEISSVTSTGGEASAANVLTPDPKEIFEGGAASYRELRITLPANTAVDSFFIGYTNAAVGEQVRLRRHTANFATADAQLGTYDLREADAGRVRSSKFVHLATPVTGRYFSIDFLASAAPRQAGVIALGKAFKTEWDKEWGSGRRVIDTGKATQLPSGGFGVEGGARKAAFKWSFGDLTDAETRDLYDMQMRLGLTSPLVVVENSGETVGVDQQIHYGLFSRLDEYERRRHNETKWQLEIEQWV